VARKEAHSSRASSGGPRATDTQWAAESGWMSKRHPSCCCPSTETLARSCSLTAGPPAPPSVVGAAAVAAAAVAAVPHSPPPPNKLNSIRRNSKAMPSPRALVNASLLTTYLLLTYYLLTTYLLLTTYYLPW